MSGAVDVCVCGCAVRYHREPTFTFMSKSYQMCGGDRSKMCHTLHEVILKKPGAEPVL